MSKYNPKVFHIEKYTYADETESGDISLYYGDTWMMHILLKLEGHERIHFNNISNRLANGMKDAPWVTDTLDPEFEGYYLSFNIHLKQWFATETKDEASLKHFKHIAFAECAASLLNGSPEVKAWIKKRYQARDEIKKIRNGERE